MTTDFTGIALVISAVLTPFSVIFLAWLNNRNARKNHETTKEVLKVAVQVDQAVNGKSPGESSLSQDVTTIKDKQELDHPSAPPVADVEEGLKTTVAKLTKAVEQLLSKGGEP